MPRLFLCLLVFAAACGQPTRSDQPDAKDTTAPVTSVNPASVEQVGPLAVVLTTDGPATIRYTTDGSDPRTSETAVVADNTVTLALAPPSKTVLTFSAVDAAGNEEEPRSETYTLLEALVPASLSGRVLFPDALRGGQMGIALYDRDPRLGGALQPIRVLQQAVGATGVLNYKFDGLTAGSYWVAAGWWPGVAFSGDPRAFGIAFGAPVALDPDDEAKARADFIDVYVGRCDPEGPGVEGEVLVAEPLQDLNIAVGLLDRPLRTSGGAEPIGFAFALGSGERRTFALCHDSAAPAYLIASATPEGSEEPAALTTHPDNPLDLGSLQTVTLRLGLPEPALGSISGDIRLSAPMPGATVTVILTDEPPSESSPIVAMSRYEIAAATQIPWAIHGLADGTWFVSALVKTAAGAEAFVQSGTAKITAEAKAATLDIEINARGVSGTVTVIGAPAGIGQVAVGVTRVGETDPAAFTTVTLGAADLEGIRNASYSLFGLADGQYDVYGVVDYAGDGRFDDDFPAHTQAGSPSRVTVSSTGSVTSDITFDFTEEP